MVGMAKGLYLGELEYLVLLTIARLGRDAYGMAVHQHIRWVTRRQVTPPTIYVTMARLEAKHYVTFQMRRLGDSPLSRPKKVYTVTKTGAEALQRSRDMAERLWRGLNLDRYL